MAVSYSLFWWLNLIIIATRLHESAGWIVNMPNENWADVPYAPAPLWDSNWYQGTATYYTWFGNSGACGFPWSYVNNVDTVAVPDPRYSDILTTGVANIRGAACGQCYMLKCANVPSYGHSLFCNEGRVVTVRVVDFDVPGTWNAGSWPGNHFDMKPSSFSKIADLSAGYINIKWRRVRCPSTLVKWTLAGDSNAFWKDMVIFNAPNVGSVHKVYTRPSNRNEWFRGKRIWGSHFSFLGGYALDSRSKVMVYFAEGKGARLAAHASDK